MSLCLLAIVLAVFWPATRNGFINYDDPRYVLNNPYVQTGLTGANLAWAFTTGYAANWHPLTWISHMVDCRIFGLSARAHHLTSVILHAFNTVLLFGTLRQLTGSTWRSLCVAAIFGLHPLRVESVAWVAERKDVLSTLFWMLTLWFYGMWVQRSQKGIAGARRFYWLALGSLGLGLMSKPMLVTVPCTLLLLDYWPLRRFRPDGNSSLWSLSLEKWPFFALALAASVITVRVQREGGAVKGVEAFPFHLRLENAVVSYGQYLGKFFVPSRLAVFYPYPESFSAGTVAAFAGLLLVITVVALRKRKERPWIIMGWLWYLGTLVPAIGLIQVGAQAMADRYTYVPLVGIAIAVVWTGHELAMRWRVPRPIAVGGAAAGVLAFAVTTRGQIDYWKDSETLFRHAIAATDRNDVAHVNLGIALDAKGATDAAISELETAVEIAPKSAAAYLNLGVLLEAVGRFDEAIERLDQAVRLEPGWAECHFCLGRTLYGRNRIAEAIPECEEAVRLKADYAEAQLELGTIYYTLRRPADALPHFQAYLRLRPDSADANNNVGTSLFVQGRLDEARPYFEAALRLQPSHEAAQRNLEELMRARERGTRR